MDLTILGTASKNQLVLDLAAVIIKQNVAIGNLSHSLLSSGVWHTMPIASHSPQQI